MTTFDELEKLRISSHLLRECFNHWSGVKPSLWTDVIYCCNDESLRAASIILGYCFPFRPCTFHFPYSTSSFFGGCLALFGPVPYTYKSPVTFRWSAARKLHLSFGLISHVPTFRFQWCVLWKKREKDGRRRIRQSEILFRARFCATFAQYEQSRRKNKKMVAQYHSPQPKEKWSRPLVLSLTEHCAINVNALIRISSLFFSGTS